MSSDIALFLAAKILYTVIYFVRTKKYHGLN